jgi:hypothetical protein
MPRRSALLSTDAIVDLLDVSPDAFIAALPEVRAALSSRRTPDQTRLARSLSALGEPGDLRPASLNRAAQNFYLRAMESVLSFPAQDVEAWGARCARALAREAQSHWTRRMAAEHAKADLDFRKKLFSAPIFRAIEIKDENVAIAAVDALLAMGADPLGANAFGHTPLVAAARRGRLGLFQLLLPFSQSGDAGLVDPLSLIHCVHEFGRGLNGEDLDRGIVCARLLLPRSDLSVRGASGLNALEQCILCADAFVRDARSRGEAPEAIPRVARLLAFFDDLLNAMHPADILEPPKTPEARATLGERSLWLRAEEACAVNGAETWFMLRLRAWKARREQTELSAALGSAESDPLPETQGSGALSRSARRAAPRRQPRRV